MVHRVSAKKLSRDSKQRNALLKSLAKEVVLHEKIITTLPRAKTVRPFLEKLVTRAKENTLVSRRYLVAKLGEERPVRKLLEIVGPVFKERLGGYTRITKLPPRVGDNAPMALLEFVENVSELAAKRKIEEKPSKKTKLEKKSGKKPTKPKRKEKTKNLEPAAKEKEGGKPVSEKSKAKK
ncbi:MAG: 50S ribosomal protein L17 [Candidatus Woykebacteria bacterium GWB1_45_5]|uniref:Large ribosomal subunit protein bL17 n=2 Tax=Candidatus Woykeibacteriota TaxID=1817899 RepID=A0A1G1W2I8_9BACT|nr:MAG: 50S ribosomal protein L17 [Candidatus Woykebacteria bacterium GWA1_44_8]OGY23307.1 MAG: 50S ribosomal protein L17 [Candidatus Woykebacteria bacterium GWB1_45_5]